MAISSEVLVRATQGGAPNVVDGHVFFDYGLPAGGIVVRAYARGFGGADTKLGETKTDAAGLYTIAYKPPRAQVDLELRTVDRKGAEISLSETKYGVPAHVTVNLVVPGSVAPLAAEYQRLTDDVSKNIGGVAALARAQENADRQDLTVLSAATGWDTRLVALAATAVAASQTTKLPSDALYALYRAGLPTDPDQLARVGTAAVGHALDAAVKAGIVAFDAQRIAATKAAYQQFAVTALQKAKPSGTVSTYGELLAASGLTDKDKAAFAQVYLDNGADPAQLWKQAQAKNIAPDKIAALQLQGKLAYLTLNNAALTTVLQREVGSADGLAKLVEQDLHQPDGWKNRLTALAKGDDKALAAMIPPQYRGATTKAKLDAYAGDLARRVRTSFPTHVVARMLDKGELASPHAAAPAAVSAVLRNAAPLGFALGRTPVDAFVAANKTKVFAGVNAADAPAVTAGVKQLARLVQITPTDESLKVTAAIGFTSAHDIASIPRERFIDLYGGRYPSPSEADLVYRKAQQVTTVVFNFFAAAKSLDSAPPVYAVSGSTEQRVAAKQSLIKQYPTMATLFGSLDFCECEECRSVLSPAAYLVDLFQFLDPSASNWQSFLNDWRTKHGNTPYPCRTAAELAEFLKTWQTEQTPYSVLLERRPDLPNLPLTCDNTNTVMPYIDIVNEILEYFVVHSALAADSGHDTGSAVSAELIAEPQNILPHAYDLLSQAKFPLALPFDLWHETVRRFFEHVGVAFADVLETFRPPAYASDALTVGGAFAAGVALRVTLTPVTGPAVVVNYATQPGDATLAGVATSLAAAVNASAAVAGPAAFLQPAVATAATVPLRALAPGAAQNAIALAALGAGVSLTAAAPSFSGGDELFAPASNPNAYYRADVFAESLGLARAEYAVFTDQTVVNDWFRLYGYANANDALTALASAKTLAGALGLTYRELTTIISTSFINPRLAALAVLEKIGVDVRDVFRYENSPKYPPLSAGERAAFEQKLADATAAFPGFDAAAWLAGVWANSGFDGVIVLADPDSGCNFAQTTVRYANVTDADAIVFLRLNLFVRLWRKLGWTIDETDSALQAFVPQNLLPLTVANTGAAFTSALLGIAHLKSLDAALPVGKDSRAKLLTLWSNLPAAGRRSLYAKLFLTRSILKTDTAFDDALGNYLSKGGVLLNDHLAGVQAAISLSADDIGRVLTDAGLNLATAALSMNNVSLLYRYGLLAKALGLSVRALITLKSLSGLDPFASIPAAPVTTLQTDVPFSQTLRFVAVATTVRASGFSGEDLDYLLRHQFDPLGKYKQDRGAFLALVRTLALGLRAIAAAQAMPADATALTDDLLQRQLALVLPADAVTTFMGMWTSTVQFEAVQRNVLPADKLDPAAFAKTPASVVYDAVAQRQRLTYTGVLDNPARAALQAAAGPKLATNTSRLVLDALLGAVQAQIQAFYDKELGAILSPADYASVIAPPAAGLTPQQAQAAMVAKRQTLLQSLLPYVAAQLTLQFIVQTLVTSLGADPSLVRALITDATLAGDRSVVGNPPPLLGAFAATAAAGVDATFYASTDGSGAPLLTTTTATADTSAKPANARSARIEGYFEVPAPGPYRFFAELDKAGAQAELRLDFLPDALIQGTAAADAAELSGQVDLNAGVLYHFTFEAHVLGGGDARLLVQGETIPKDALRQLALSAKTAVDRTARAQILLAKIDQYVQTLPLDERELRYLLANAADFDGLTFTGLPVAANDAGATAPAALFAQFLRLAAYAQLRTTIAGGGDDLIGVFENAKLTYPASTDALVARNKMPLALGQRIADLTRRDLPTVLTAVARFAYAVTSYVSGGTLTVVAPDFRNEKGIAKLWDVLQLVTKLGVPIDAPQRWATAAPTFATAQDLRSTVKAQYSAENWLTLAPSIFDKLRQSQRDALVAYCMHQKGFAEPGQLFEYFLVDPGMEPVVQTSRLRLAISSVQTFVQRCLLNLEPEVQPSALNAAEWRWMKRYRVWEANRKIFLFPENWLDPAFRDDKTDLYTELEGALLQGDASNDLAEDAFFTYLKKLQEVARLEIVTIYCDQNPLDPASSTLHVVGRTHSLPHKYFYRRFAFGMWTPWEPVGVEIDGDHVVAAMWRGRLNLFWLTFMAKNQQDESAQPQTINFKDAFTINRSVPRKLVHVQLNWSEYFQGKWTTRQTSGFSSGAIVTTSGFDESAVFVHARVLTENGKEVVTVNLRVDGAFLADFGPATIDFAFRVVSRNSPPELSQGFAFPPDDPPYRWDVRARTHYYSSNLSGAPNPLEVTYVDRITSLLGDSIPNETTKTILGGNGDTFALTVLGTPVTMGAESDVGALVSPFFYQDNHNAFYVEPELTETTVTAWESWGTTYTPPNPSFNDPVWWNNLPILQMVPKRLPTPVNPGDPVFNGVFDDGARFSVQPANDWVTNQNTVVDFGGTLVGRGGGLTLQSAGGGTAAMRNAGGLSGVAKSGVGGTFDVAGMNIVGSAGVGSLRRTIGDVLQTGAGGAPASAALKGIGQ